MLDKLDATEQQYEQVMQRLGSAELQADQTEYRKQAKTLADIEPTVERYREYKAVEHDIAGAQELAASGDAEMRQLASKPLSLMWCSTGRNWPPKLGCGQLDRSWMLVAVPSGTTAKCSVPMSSSCSSAVTGAARSRLLGKALWMPRG